MLIVLYLFEDVLILILGIEVEGAYHLLEQGHVHDLVAFTCRETLGIVEKDFECFFLVFQDFGGFKMLLSHVRLSNVGGLVAGD